MRVAAFLLLIVTLVPSSLPAQYAGGTRLADLEQDLMILRNQVGEIRIAMEALQRENAALRQALNNQSSAGANQSYVTLQQLDNSIRALRQELQSADSRTKAEVITEVTRQIERLAGQTQQAMTALAGAVQSSPQAPAQVINFSDDFPKNGVAYVVKPGDTLSGIARDLNASIRDIQNANKIADPKSLRAGQTLFIPQRKE